MTWQNPLATARLMSRVKNKTTSLLRQVNASLFIIFATGCHFSLFFFSGWLKNCHLDIATMQWSRLHFLHTQPFEWWRVFTFDGCNTCRSFRCPPHIVPCWNYALWKRFPCKTTCSEGMRWTHHALSPGSQPGCHRNRIRRVKGKNQVKLILFQVLASER